MPKNKTTIKTMPVTFVWRVATVEVPSLYGAGLAHESHPVGPMHIHRVVGGGLTRCETALCGHAWIPDAVTASSDIRPAGLALCPACQTAWKSAPDSPWNAWTGGALALVMALVSLACLTPTVVPLLALSTPTPVPLIFQVLTHAPTAQTAEPTATPERRSVPECVRVTAASLHVRDLPDFETGAVVGYLFNGDVARVLDRAGEWVRTRDGWSHADWTVAVECP